VSRYAPDGTLHPRRALVTGSTNAARRHSRELLGPTVIIENAVLRAIEEGRIGGTANNVGGIARVYLDGGVAAIVKRTTSPMTGRLAWSVIDVEPEKAIA
jgi:hypothetical protein